MFFSKKTFKIKLRGRSEIVYYEGNKKLTIGSEFLAGDSGIVIYSRDLVHWDPPHEKETLSDLELIKIKVNIITDLKAYKINAEWVD